MEYTGERMIPWNLHCGRHIINCHVMRYAWALERVFGRDVVDLGCGTGYGSFLLSWAANRVYGVDIDEEVIGFAVERFQASNLAFGIADVTKDYWHADVYVAFEVLEHLEHPGPILTRFAPLLWSIPVNDGSRFHRRTYDLATIDALMGDSAKWFQSQAGEIVHREVAWFRPAYVLGLRETVAEAIGP